MTKLFTGEVPVGFLAEIMDIEHGETPYLRALGHSTRQIYEAIAKSASELEDRTREFPHPKDEGDVGAAVISAIIKCTMTALGSVIFAEGLPGTEMQMAEQISKRATAAVIRQAEIIIENRSKRNSTPRPN